MADLFDVLEQDVYYYSSLGCVAVCGDLNSRVGNKNDFVVHDDVSILFDDPSYIPDSTPARASIDNVCNSHGVRLLDLCKSTSLRIVNGRVGNTDQYTFLSHNGLSVIDYLLMH